MPEDRRHTSTVRKHAAIMFTDIAGYTSLMGSDEDAAFDMLKCNHMIHDTFIKKHNGTLIKEIGDGTLASFPLASDAVRCASEIQKEAKNQNIPLKIGIHEGEMVFAGSDVLGDGVNIASRLQEEAQSGCIHISASVYRDIKNKADIKTKFLAEKTLKNVDDPIKIYSVISEGYVEDTTSLSSSKSSLLQEKSIIVLPFVNISPDPDQEYFSDGLTEEIITDLSHIHDLLVISRSSAMTFKGTKSTIKEIAEKVNVRYVLEGSVRKAGNNLRITAQLIDGLNDTHLWAEKYSGTLEDIFDIQEKVSRLIVDSLKIKISAIEKGDLSRKKLDNPTVYEQYLLARHEIWRCTNESLDHAIKILNSSLDSIGENEYILVALAYAYFQYVNVGIDPDVKYLNKAEKLIDEALLLNPDLSKAHFVRSMIYETKGETREAFISIKKAFELDPNDADVLMMMGFIYNLVGKPDEAKPYAKHAIEVDPLSPIAYSAEWWVNSSEGRFDRVLETAYKMYSIDKGSLLSIWTYAYGLACNNKVKKATKLFDSLIEKYPGQFLSMLGKALRHAINNQKQEALNSISDQIKKAAEIDHLWAWWLADVYALIGEKNKAIDYVERATRDIFINYPFFSKHDPLLKNIRDEDRFKKLMEEVKYKWENFEV